MKNYFIQKRLSSLLLYSLISAIFISLSHPVIAQTDQENKKFLSAMNKQVNFMNHTDNLLMPVFQELTKLNEKMVAYVDNDFSGDPIKYRCTFEVPELRYKQSNYQNHHINLEFRGDVVARMERLMEDIRAIGQYCDELETYFNRKSYLDDKMIGGFIILKEMDKKLRKYLVAHEAWHAALTTAWSTYYMQRQSQRSPNLIIRMERVISTGHTVYLDLGYDPDYTDSKKHFKELNENLTKLKGLTENDENLSGNADFQGFVQPMNENYIEELGIKNSLAFYKKFNGRFVKDINKKLIDNFNKFVNEEDMLVLNASRLPPFFVFQKPHIDLDSLQLAIESQPDVPIVEDTTSDPVKPVKESKLEGFASNNLVFLIDVSGSMKNAGKLDTLKSSFKYLLNEMRPEDKISIVVYSGNARVMLKPTSALDSDRILTVINNLQSEGKSNVDQGLLLAYQQASIGYVNKGNNRIVLVTDGFITYKNSSESLINKKAGDGIALSVFFFGNVENPNVEVGDIKNLAEIGQGNFIEVSPFNANDKMIKEAQAVIEPN